MIAFAFPIATIVLLALLPGPARSLARAVLVFAVVLSPLVALGIWLAYWPAVRIGTWFLFIPLTVIYLASIDLRLGISARLARLPRSR